VDTISTVVEVVKHLQGKHDQKEHAPKRVSRRTPAVKKISYVFGPESRKEDIDDLLSHIFKGKNITYQDIADAFDGGLDRLPEGSEIQLKFVDDYNELRVIGKILDVQGRKMGGFERSIHRAGGKIVVNHDSFFLNKSYQGSGFGTEFFFESQRKYEKLGVDQIEVMAGDKVGGYAWARMGFDFYSVNDRRRAIDAIDTSLIDLDLQRTLKKTMPRRKGEDKYDHEDRLTDAEGDIYNSIMSQVERFRYPYQFAAFTVKIGDEVVPLGKKAMLGSDWMGVKKLKTKSKAYWAGQEFYKLKKRRGQKKWVH